MKSVLIYFFLILLISLSFAETKGNPDILKRIIIDDCEGIDEFGNCITNKEIDPINEKIAGTIFNIGTTTAVNLGVSDSSDLITLTIIFLIIIGGIILVLKRASE